MARILLLLPSATYRASDFLAAANRLGAEVVVASEVAQTIDMGPRSLVLDLGRPEAAAATVEEAARRHPLDAVVAVDDQGVLVAALASRALGLPHNPPEAVAATRDKAAMRATLAAARTVRQPDFRVVAPEEDVAAAAERLGFPCVVKATGLSASRGIIRADDPAQAATAGERARAITAEAHGHRDHPLLVEQYVDGAEVAVEALLRGGELDVLAVFDKPDPLVGPYFEETLYVTPSRLPARLQARVVEAVTEAAAALGLREGPIHAELRVPTDYDGDTPDPDTPDPGPDGDRRPWLLEVAARSIGGLCSRALRFGAGVSLEELILRHALALPLDPVREEAASGVMMLPIPAAGRLVGVRGQEAARSVPGIEGLEVAISPGRPVRPLPEGDRYLGFLFARGATAEAVENALREAHGHLEVVIDPG